MAREQNWVYNDFSQEGTLVLFIDDEEFEIAQLSMSFALNAIPRAACMIAVGRNIRTKDQAAIHKVLNLRKMLKASIEFYPFNSKFSIDTDEFWPDTPLVIFDGYYTGVSYAKISGKIQPVIHLIHWLVDMDGSSVLNANQHPGSPASMLTVAAKGPIGAASVTDLMKPSYVLSTGSAIDFTIKDVWEGIRDIFMDLCERPKFNLKGLGCNPIQRTNDTALKALKRFETGGRFFRPLLIDGTIAKPVGTAIGKVIVQRSAFLDAENTFWGKLLQHCADFQMAVIPRATSALVVASVPSYQNAYKIITPAEFVSFEMTSMLNRPIAAVGVIGSYITSTNPVSSNAPRPFSCISGTYPTETGSLLTGLNLAVPAPPWLANSSLANNRTPTQQTPPTATSGSGSTPDPPNPDPNTSESLTPVYDLYARSVYVENVLRGRSAKLSGKLRFDISPGSTVCIMPSVEKMIGTNDQLAIPFYAYVRRVDITINAEGQFALTSFDLSDVRTEAENNDPNTSMDKHPLFGDAVALGASLAEESDTDLSEDPDDNLPQDPYENWP